MDGQKGGLSLPYQNRSPLSAVSQTIKSDHVLTQYCWNEVVDRREHKENCMCCTAASGPWERDLKSSPGAAQHVELVITSKAARFSLYEKHGGLPFPLLYLQPIHHCRIHQKDRQNFFPQWFTKGCVTEAKFPQFMVVFCLISGKTHTCSYCPETFLNILLASSF